MPLPLQPKLAGLKESIAAAAGGSKAAAAAEASASGGSTVAASASAAGGQGFSVGLLGVGGRRKGGSVEVDHMDTDDDVEEEEEDEEFESFYRTSFVETLADVVDERVQVRGVEESVLLITHALRSVKR